MNGTEDVDKSDWKQEAIRLLDSFEHLSESYEDELPTLPPIEFILVQDTRSEGHVGLGESLFDRHHLRAKRRLKPLFELPVDEQWWDENRSVESRTRVFCTNMPKRDPHDSPKDVQSSSLLGFRNQMQRLFRKGDGLLQRPPFALPQMRQWPLHRRDNVTEEVTVNPRSLSITNGIQWLSLLFEASWGPADAFRLKNERWTYRQSSEIGSDRTRSTLVHWTDVPEDNSLFSGCFFSISQNVLDDCARLTKWLLSLLEAEVSNVATIELRAAGAETETQPRLPAKRAIEHRRNNEEIFKAALSSHHQYDGTGSVLNYLPISARQIETMTRNAISDSTARRLFVKHFGSIDNYRQACFTSTIGRKLVILLGDGLFAFGTNDADSTEDDTMGDDDSGE